MPITDFNGIVDISIYDDMILPKHLERLSNMRELGKIIAKNRKAHKEIKPIGNP